MCFFSLFYGKILGDFFFISIGIEISLKSSFVSRHSIQTFIEGETFFLGFFSECCIKIFDDTCSFYLRFIFYESKSKLRSEFIMEIERKLGEGDVIFLESSGNSLGDALCLSIVSSLFLFTLPFKLS